MIQETKPQQRPRQPSEDHQGVTDTEESWGFFGGIFLLFILVCVYINILFFLIYTHIFFFFFNSEKETENIPENISLKGLVRTP